MFILDLSNYSIYRSRYFFHIFDMSALIPSLNLVNPVAYFVDWTEYKKIQRKIVDETV